MSHTLRWPRLSLPDRLALLALCGMCFAAVAWLVIAFADAVLSDTTFRSELLAPDPRQAIIRLTVIVFVLLATLVVQTLFARRYRAEQRYRHLVETSPDMVLVHHNGRIAYVNTPGARLMGFDTPSDAIGQTFLGRFEPNGSGHTPEELERAIASGQLARPTHVKLRRGDDGTLIDVELTAQEVGHEAKGAVQCVCRDISARIRAEETIQRMAYFDPLTGLPNRALFRDRLTEAIATARRRAERVAVIFVDLDDFKAINDTLGHSVGDGVLVELSNRIRSVLRDEDSVARQGGDEFTVLARIDSRDNAQQVAERISAAIGATIDVDGHGLRITASMGMATFPEDGEDEDRLIRNADAAMYHAKKLGHNVSCLYAAEMSFEVIERLELEGAMRTALENHEFELYYQPQIDVRDGHCVGAEALLRWNHPTRGTMSPSEFIYVAEQAGLIGEIGRWLLETACAQAQSWLEEGLPLDRIAVNLSAREFVQRNILESVVETLAATGLPAHRLELEITETVAMYSTEQILRILRSLRTEGVRLAIDDFGTGYSSLSYLKHFPVQTLKIAQDFMRDVDVDPQSAAIASLLINLCRALGLDIVAEGVENESQLEFLTSRGCNVIQGFLFCRPVPASQMHTILADGLSSQREAWDPSTFSAR